MLLGKYKIQSLLLSTSVIVESARIYATLTAVMAMMMRLQNVKVTLVHKYS